MNNANLSINKQAQQISKPIQENPLTSFDLYSSKIKRVAKSVLKTLSFIAFFFGVFVLGFFSHWLYQNYFQEPVIEKTAHQPPIIENYIQTPDDQTQNYWEDYVSKEYKIKFKHPISLFQAGNQPPNGLILNSLNQETLTILVNTTKEKNNCYKIINQEQSFLNDLPVVKEMVEGLTNPPSCNLAEQLSIWLSTRYKENKYQIIFTYNKTNKISSERTFNQILSTIEFLN